MATKEANHDPTGCTPNDVIIVDRGGDVVGERMGGPENGWRARRTRAGVNTMEGAGGCYRWEGLLATEERIRPRRWIARGFWQFVFDSSQGTTP